MIALLAGLAWAEVPPPPAVLASGVDPHLGERLPLGVRLTDEGGRQAPLASWLRGRPLVLQLAWFRCDRLCGVSEQGLRDAARALGGLGTTWDALTVSFDPDETPADAARARARAEAAWPFLVGGPGAVGALTAAVGVRASRDPSGAWAHPAVAVVVGPDARVAGYVLGPRPEPAELRAALDAAAAGRTARAGGSWIDTCFHLPSTGGRAALFLRGGFAALVAGLALAGAALVRRRA